MDKFYPRSVLFVRDAPRALEYYRDTLGFSVDWTYEEQGKPYVLQVNLYGAEIILNQCEPEIAERAGHGRVFIGLDDDQSAVFNQHLQDRKIAFTMTHWGAPTIALHDQDQNELFFWLPEAERLKLET